MKINVSTPWYPDASLGHVYSGVFVKNQVSALREFGLDVKVSVPKIYHHPYKYVPSSLRNTLFKVAEKDSRSALRQDGEVVFIPCIVPNRVSMQGRVRSIQQGLLLNSRLVC